MTQKLMILGRFPSLNEYINKERGNKYAGSAMKRRETERVAALCKEQKIKPVERRALLTFICYEANNRRDSDNVISIVLKFVLDGLVKAGIIEDDSRKYIDIAVRPIEIDKIQPRVEVYIEEL